MADREMSDVERRAMNAANKIWRDIQMRDAHLAAGEPEPDTNTFYLQAKGTYHRFELEDGKRAFHYYEGEDQWRFAYTPWSDVNDWYWSWVTKPVGKGSRSGTATKFKRYKFRKHRKRKDARARAERMFNKRYQN